MIEAMDLAVGQVLDLLDEVRVTEIMYNPQGGNAFEYIELQNVGDTEEDLSGFSFEGITFRFAENSPPLAAGAYLLLVNDANVQAFRARYPGVRVDLTLSDMIVDLVEERADVAIRIGPLRDTRLRAKKLGHSRMALVASPDYLARRGTPATPNDLAGHDCLRFSFRRSVDSWPFRIGRKIVQLPVEGAYFGNSGEVVRQMALAGCGIARHGYFHVARDLEAGRLIEILADYAVGDGEDIHALYAAEDRTAARVRAFLDFLEGIELPG